MARTNNFCRHIAFPTVLMFLVLSTCYAQTPQQPQIVCKAAGCPIAVAKVKSALRTVFFSNTISILDQDLWAKYKKAWKVSDRQTIAFTNPDAHITYLRLKYVLNADIDTGQTDSLHHVLLHELGHMVCEAKNVVELRGVIDNEETCAENYANTH